MMVIAGLGFRQAIRAAISRRTKVPLTPTLPLELVFQVLDAVADNHDKTTLTLCALVCRGWRRYAQALLFRDVGISSRETFFLFEDSLSSNNPRSSNEQSYLSQFVVNLSVTLNFNSPYGLTEEHLVELVQMCSNLRHLSITTYGCTTVFKGQARSALAKDRLAPSFSQRAINALKSASHVRSLTFSNWSDNAEMPLQILQAWPMLENLTLRGTPPVLRESSPPPRLQALRHFSLTVQPYPSVDTLKWLLSGSTTTLKSFHFGCDVPQSILQYIVQAHASELESLSLPYCDHRHVTLFRKCTSLKHLKIEQPLPMAIISDIPRTLRALALGIDINVSSDSLTSLLSDMPYLQQVSFLLWTDNHIPPFLRTIQRLCTARAIDFTSFSHSQPFRAI